MGRGSSGARQSNVFGKKGRPRTMEQALGSVNPNFAQGIEWQTNCQRCVYTYEMQRRGYNVEALPRILNGKDEAAEKWAEAFSGQTWDKMPSRNTINSMLSKMTEYGEGARAVVYVKWRGKNSAHVFIAEQEGKGTVFLDPQTGKYVNIRHYMDYAVKGKTMLSRVDNLSPKEEVVKDYMRKRAK